MYMKMKFFNMLCSLTSTVLLCKFCVCLDYCYNRSDNCSENIEHFRYLFYDVNPPEGFNLRRDVYMRFAALANSLKQSNNPDLNKFKLVLPPWSHLFHWNYSEIPEQLPWGWFFDIKSLQMFAPVIEMVDFFKEIGDRYKKINIEVFILQHFQDMFENGKFEDKMEISECQRQTRTNFFHYKNISSSNITCLSFHGSTLKLKKLLSISKAKYILIDHAEIALHPTFGDKKYWQARRSMRFNKDLCKIARLFRRKHLNSTEENEGTSLPNNWMDEKARRNAQGGPYLGIHLRRRDFVRSRSNEIPNLKDVSDQIQKLLLKLNLKTVFIATDAPDEEFQEIKSLLKNWNVIKYLPDNETIMKYKDGGIAIIEQIICSYSRYFVGTYESTFTFRIQEEREILGFPEETTFNCLCKRVNCQKPSIWKIVY